MRITTEKGWALHPKSYEEGIEREWLVANGIGGYASSTIIGANTRAYHGLLVAAQIPPVDRRLLLSSLDEELVNGGFKLGCHQYPGAVYPEGFLYLDEFSLYPSPTFIYRAGSSSVVKQVKMPKGENTVTVSYKVSGYSGPVHIVPLVTQRTFHHADSPPGIHQSPSSHGVDLDLGSSLYLISDRCRYICDEQVYYNFEYEEERRRNLAFREDLLSPGRFEIDIDGQGCFCITASTKRTDPSQLLSSAFIEESPTQTSPVEELKNAATSFVVRRGDGCSIIAGYHWFDDWGRDAMISLPGLLLSTRNYGWAAEVLFTFASAMRDGIIPNDLGAGSYNTADASLWFVRAAHCYLRSTGDAGAIRRLWPRLIDVVRNYKNGNAVARMDSDGLIKVESGMTWMDARVDGSCVTPRSGKPCEINALWYGALKSMQELSKAAGSSWDPSLARRVKGSYSRFWNDEMGCLYDVIDEHDPSIRPNQVIAAAFSFDLLDSRRTRSILEVSRRELLTPYGLRTLSPADPHYIGRYEGSPAQRDAAYHQGTVWPWLIGPYITAYVNANRRKKSSREDAISMLQPLFDHLRAAGLGTISEIYDGDVPHRPCGCISQAWSVGEVLRVWNEDIFPRKNVGVEPRPKVPISSLMNIGRR